MTDRAPDVRYATTSDGVSIACWSVGDGLPIIISHNFGLSHAELEWEIPSLRRFYQALGARHQVIRFDPRLAGLSDPAAPSASLQAMCLDIDAVADTFGHDVFALMGVSSMGPVAVEYAASRPQRVSSLVFCDPVLVPGGSGALARGIQASIALAESSGAELAAEMFLARWVEPSELDVAKRIAMSGFERLPNEAVLDWDPTASLGKVRVPTLVVSSMSPVLGDMEPSRRIAAAIPDARLVRIEGRMAPYYLDASTAIAAMEEHLGAASGHGSLTRPAGLQTIVFTDVVDSTSYTNRVGDEVARKELQRIEGIVDNASGHRGRVVKHLGDGTMLVFESPTAAVDFALEVQSRLEQSELAVRVGMAVGEPIEDDGDLHGAVVNLAARIAAAAAPGQVLISDGTRQLLVGKPYGFSHVGTRNVKGFEEPIGLYEVAHRSG